MSEQYTITETRSRRESFLYVFLNKEWLQQYVTPSWFIKLFHLPQGLISMPTAQLFIQKDQTKMLLTNKASLEKAFLEIILPKGCKYTTPKIRADKKKIIIKRKYCLSFDCWLTTKLVNSSPGCLATSRSSSLRLQEISKPELWKSVLTTQCISQGYPCLQKKKGRQKKCPWGFYSKT